MSYRIMIVEDEYLTAMDMAMELEGRGVTVTGLFNSVSQAIQALKEPKLPHAVILDIRLHDMAIYPVADLLKQKGIPFVFATGCFKSDLPARFASAPRFEKPFRVSTCVDGALALAQKRADGRAAFLST